MPSPSEKKRRQTMVQELSQRKHEEAETRMPISKAHLVQLFDQLDVALVEGCDHTLAITRTFLQTHQLPEATIVAWLGEYGGFCDCEVLANVEEAWGN